MVIPKHQIIRAAATTLAFAGFSHLCQAQSSDNHTAIKPPAGITIDGNLQEWGDTLRYYNDAQKINYALANDHDNIYIAVRIGERSQQARVLNNGLTISINTKGKKKDTYSVTFPVGNEDPMQRLAAAQQPAGGDMKEEDHEEMMRARLTSLRNIRVTGFKDVESDIITTANTYGFKTAMTYDDKGYLLYEVAIPLKLMDYEGLTKSEWAFDFKVNGMKQPTAGGNDSGMGQAGGMGGGRGGRGGMGGGMGRGGMRGGGGGMGRGGMGQGNFNRGDMFKTVDFWDKFVLQQ